MSTLNELAVAGKPVLLTAGSSTGAMMMAKETAWMMGLEPRELDVEMLDSSMVDSAWQSFNSGDFIIVTEARRADQETQEAVKKVMSDPEKIVFVADCNIPSHLPPTAFAHFADFRNAR